MSGKQKLIVGITGASGAIYGVTALKALRELGVETQARHAAEAGRAQVAGVDAGPAVLPQRVEDHVAHLVRAHAGPVIGMRQLGLRWD